MIKFFDLQKINLQYTTDFHQTFIQTGQILGANANVLAKMIVVVNAPIRKGTLITKDVPTNTICFVNQAKQKEIINDFGKIIYSEKI